MPTSYNPRESLIRELRAERVVFVVGAGFSIASAASGAPAGWPDLITHGLSFAEAIGAVGADDATRIEELAENRTPGGLIAAASKVETALREVPSGFGIWMVESAGRLQLAHSQLRDALRALNVTIATTNYDTLLSDGGGPPPIPWTDGPRSLNVLRGDVNGILHLHGVYDVPDSIVFGDAGYNRVRADEFAQFRQQALAAVRTLVFVGCGEGLHDPNMASLLDWLAFRGVQHAHFRLVRSEERGAVPNAHVIDVPFGNDFGDLAPFLEGLAADAGRSTVRKTAETPEEIGDELSALGPIGELLKKARRADVLGQYADAYTDACIALDESLSLPEDDEQREELLARARATCAGLILRVDGEPGDAYEMVSLALNTGFMRSNPRNRFSALITRAESGILARRIPEARGALSAASRLAESDDDRRRTVLQVEAHLHMVNEDFEKAATAWGLAAEQFSTAHGLAEDDAETTRTARGMALCWHNRGLALGRSGDLVGACRDLQAAANSFATISVPEDEVPCLYFLAEYQFRSELFPQGFASVGRAIELAAAHHLDLWGMKGHELKARAYYTRDSEHRREALQCLYEASQIAHGRDDHDTLRRCLQMTATVYAENRQFDIALHYLEGAAIAANSGADALAIADVARQTKEVMSKQPRPRSEEARRRAFENAKQILARTVAAGELEATMDQMRAVIWSDGPPNDGIETPALSGASEHDPDDGEMDVGPALRDKLDTAATVAETARIMMQLGGWNLQQSDPYEAGLWFSRAQEAAQTASLPKLVASALVGQVVVALADDAYDAVRETARLDEAAATLGHHRDPEVEAAIEFHRGRLLAGEDDPEAALVSFERVRNMASRVYEERLVSDAEDWIRRIEAHLALLRPAQLSLSELAEEVTELESWYPEEREGVRKFWYYWRDEDIMRNATAVNGAAKCLVMAGTADEFGVLCRGLSGLFDLIFYSSETPFVGSVDEMATELVPFPADRPLPNCVNVIGIPIGDANPESEPRTDASPQ
jgi:tetratricopeptide (TPR) repeat protein